MEGTERDKDHYLVLTQLVEDRMEDLKKGIFDDIFYFASFHSFNLSNVMVTNPPSFPIPPSISCHPHA